LRAAAAAAANSDAVHTIKKARTHSLFMQFHMKDQSGNWAFVVDGLRRVSLTHSLTGSLSILFMAGGDTSR
jgi:hypothetical protein